MFLSPTNGKIAPCFPCETSLFAIKYRAHSHKNAKKKGRKNAFLCSWFLQVQHYCYSNGNNNSVVIRARLHRDNLRIGYIKSEIDEHKYASII